MSAADTETKNGFEIIDHNIVPDLYVTYIVDTWEGDRNDPATQINRYIGVWKAEDLESEERGAFDPDFGEMLDRYGYRRSRYSRRSTNKDEPEPLVWEHLDVTKEADSDARSMRQEYESITDPNGYAYGSQRIHKDLYNAFLDAVDTLAEDPDNEQAWEAVTKFRQYQALKHEK